MLRQAVTTLNEETRTGGETARMLLKLPVEEWPVIVDAQPQLMGIGAVEVLLDAAREEFDRNAGRALAITTFIVAYLDRIDVPRELEVIRIRISGTAWKEYGNALYAVTAWEEAAHAARRARNILEAHPALSVDRASATVLLALVLNEQGRQAEAEALLAECEDVFASHGDKRRWLSAIETRAVILSNDEQRLPEALPLWHRARAEAERIHDLREAARIQNNIGRCAAKLGRWEEALAHHEDAERRFEELHMDGELQRARAAIAEVRRQVGTDPDADILAELHQIQRECGRRQMHELVRALAETMDEIQEMTE